MAEHSKIEWCDHTFNPWVGCTKVSPACDNCYAESWAKRSGMVTWGAGAERRRTSPNNWKQPLKWNAEAKRLGIRYRVFCASLADVFDNAVPEQWRADLFRLIAQTPNLDWLLLTKRIGNAEKMMRESCGFYEPNPGCYTPWSNVWLGATISSQKEADRDIPKLLHVPAAKRFLSMEPLLGPVDLTRVVYPTLKRKDENDPYVAYDTLRGHMIGPDDVGLPKLDWVVVGGESGPKARLMRPDWVRSLRDQCVAAGVPFFFKQWGEFWHADAGEPPVECECFCLSDICNCYWHVGKKAAGRVLDDRVWDETPGEKQ